MVILFTLYTAGKQTTTEEVEEMLESGNPSIFTSGVSRTAVIERAPPGVQPTPS